MPIISQEARPLTPLSPVPPEIPPRPGLDEFDGRLSALVTTGAQAHRQQIGHLLQRIERTPIGRQLLAELRDLAARGSVPAVALETDMQGGAGTPPMQESAVVRLKAEMLRPQATQVGVPSDVEHAPAFFRDLVAVRNCLVARSADAIAGGPDGRGFAPLDAAELSRTFASELQEHLAGEQSHPGRDRTATFAAIPGSLSRTLSNQGSPPDAIPEAFAPQHPYGATTEPRAESGTRRPNRLRASIRWIGRRMTQLGRIFSPARRLTHASDRKPVASPSGPATPSPGSTATPASGSEATHRANDPTAVPAPLQAQEENGPAPVPAPRGRSWTVSRANAKPVAPALPDAAQSEEAPLLRPAPEPRRHRRSPSSVNPAPLAANPTPPIPEEG
ncbi:hypothetical protein [Bordetella genomosp. 9]|uniref:Uncharacterized protein n=1 Tax=Bordetella genomosp. 9 TaxID=1416803 RepID=A0A1W6Z3T0_9BORD|nr:hypothetical protein [Bordetella genomosp. 9]ARP87483.1 hypothetical protein CAL13_15670 [Bordetella genomosp. 9]